MCSFSGRQFAGEADRKRTGAQMMFGAAARRSVSVFVHIPISHSSRWQVVLSCLLALPASRVYVLDFSPFSHLVQIFSNATQEFPPVVEAAERSDSEQDQILVFFSADTSCRGYTQLILFLPLILQIMNKNSFRD